MCQAQLSRVPTGVAAHGGALTRVLAVARPGLYLAIAELGHNDGHDVQASGTVNRCETQSVLTACTYICPVIWVAPK